MGKPSDLVGHPAPPLELPSIPDGQPFKLPIGEKPIAMFFFPTAGSTGCTMEACAFRDAQVENVTFKRHPDLCVVGISGDPTAKQASFADQHNLKYPILSDADGAARKAYGVGKAFFGMAEGRETFFIDAKGIVRGVYVKNLGFHAHVDFVEKQLLATEGTG
ncbi:hypothetical protein JCM24511_09143 [Saitozyma sp. JCM 24511]|nr:hypothetical protein JCM24511_09143 [Saitozyma sp. JCM 24511]